MRRAGPLSLWLRSGSQHREDVLSPKEAGSAPRFYYPWTWGPRKGTSHEVRRALLAMFSAPRAAGRRQLQKEKELFFWREFYFWVENSRNAGREGPKSPSLLFPPNRFRLIPRSPNLKRRLRAGESGAPWRCGGSCSRRDDESAGREAGPGPARLHQAWLSGGSIRPPAVPWCNGEHSGL